ncbi:MAG: hypothetical protein M1299_12160 [Firmicutes bacterium]|nr:hypothetical protein [Bacillota bacterium]
MFLMFSPPVFELPLLRLGILINSTVELFRFSGEPSPNHVLSAKVDLQSPCLPLETEYAPEALTDRVFLPNVTRLKMRVAASPQATSWDWRPPLIAALAAAKIRLIKPAFGMSGFSRAS